MNNSFKFWKDLCVSNDFSSRIRGFDIEDLSLILLKAGLSHQQYCFSLKATSLNSRFNLKTFIFKSNCRQYGYLDLSYRLIWFDSKKECIDFILKEYHLFQTQKKVDWSLESIKRTDFNDKNDHVINSNLTLLNWLISKKVKKDLEDNLPQIGIIKNKLYL